MIFGFNTDVSGSRGMYHVQTEDRGAKNPMIDSMVYMGGKIIERVRTAYSPQVATQMEIEELVRAQHRQIVESIRAGTFSPSAQITPEAPYSGYELQLMNPQEVACDGLLRFEFRVWNRSESCAAQGTSLEVRMKPVDGEEQRASYWTDDDGMAAASFPIPVDKTELLLLACASGAIGREVVKFNVRLGPQGSA